MSLYDDIVVSGEKSGKESKSSDWSGIKLLENHLMSKKKNQAKRDIQGRRPVNSYGGPGFGLKNRTIVDELVPSPMIDFHGKTTGTFLGGEWDVSKEYDPIFPNDYEKIRKERKEQQEAKDLEERRRKESLKPQVALGPSGSSMVPRSLVGAYSDDEDDSDYSSSRVPAPAARGAAIAPPSFLIESSVKSSSESSSESSGILAQSGIAKGSVAAKIMARMGYKEGQGLGKEEQGIARALEVEKTSKRGGKIISGELPILPPPPPPPQMSSNTEASTSHGSTDSTQIESITEIMKNPTRVLLLRNMVGPGEVDDDLEPEVKEECSKYGEVVKCLIYEIPTRSHDEAVRIFIEFRRVESAIKAVVDLNGRYFGGRVVKINFYDVEKFKRLELND